MSKTRDLIWSIVNYLGDRDEKYMKIKFSSDDYLSPNKTLELCNMVMVVRFVFDEANKYYGKDSLDKFLYKL